MIVHLRHWHKRIWFSLAIILPFLFIWAYAVLPDAVYVEDLVISASIPIGNQSECKEMEQVHYCLRSDDKNKHQIEIIISSPLTNASNRLEVKGFNFGEIYVDEVLGAQGVYRWNWIDSVEASYQVRLLDKIKNEVIHITELKGRELTHHLHNH